MTVNDVNIQKIQPLGMSGAMISGSLDAASTWDPHIYNISKALGDDAIVFRDPGIYTGYSLLAVRKDWASKNEKTIIAFLKAVKKANTFATEHKDEAQAIVAKMINLDIEIVEETWDMHQLGVSLDEKILEETKHKARNFTQLTNTKTRPYPIIPFIMIPNLSTK